MLSLFSAKNFENIFSFSFHLYTNLTKSSSFSVSLCFFVAPPCNTYYAIHYFYTLFIIYIVLSFILFCSTPDALFLPFTNVCPRYHLVLLPPFPPPLSWLTLITLPPHRPFELWFCFRFSLFYRSWEQRTISFLVSLLFRFQFWYFLCNFFAEHITFFYLNFFTFIVGEDIFRVFQGQELWIHLFNFQLNFIFIRYSPSFEVDKNIKSDM